MSPRSRVWNLFWVSTAACWRIPHDKCFNRSFRERVGGYSTTLSLKRYTYVSAVGSVCAYVCVQVKSMCACVRTVTARTICTHAHPVRFHSRSKGHGSDAAYIAYTARNENTISWREQKICAEGVIDDEGDEKGISSRCKVVWWRMLGFFMIFELS